MDKDSGGTVEEGKGQRCINHASLEAASSSRNQSVFPTLLARLGHSRTRPQLLDCVRAVFGGGLFDLTSQGLRLSLGRFGFLRRSCAAGISQVQLVMFTAYIDDSGTALISK